MGSATIEATTSINENYILQLSSDAVTTVGAALQAGTVPSAEALAAYFPSDYKPFTITSDAKVVNGDKPTDDNDLSGKFWVGYETITGSDYLMIYAEIMDDVLVQGEWDGANGVPNSGGAWNFDSWEGNYSTYAITDPIAGSTVNQMGAGTSDYQFRVGVTDNADKSGYVPYAHAYNIGAVNGLVPNSITAAEVTDGMYRTLTLLSTIELSNLEATNAHIEFPGADEVSAIPFQLSINDADEVGCGGCRETQNVWSNRVSDGNFWQTPSQWEIVGLVGSNMVEAVSNEYDNIDTPLEYSLDQNYPNPFNPSTNIQFTLAATSNVTLEVYNMLGQKVATLLQGQKMNAGNHTQVFDASSLASGMYVYRISTPNFVQSRTMMLIK